MAKYALPCIACGRELRNCEEGATNQPYAGTAFTSYGHYGSTAFDSLDGHYIEINVCDLCLVQHAGRVLQGRDMRPVTEDGVQVGMDRITPLKLVPWVVSGDSFDWVVEQARREFQLVVDDEVEVGDG